MKNIVAAILAVPSKMRRIVSVMLLLAASSSVAADFASGVAAYERGDYEAALREFRPLAEQGDAEAQRRLGNMYADGQGVPEDLHQAVVWFRKAAESGDVISQVALGVLYATGRQGVIVHQNVQEAVFWFRKAATQGNARAQTFLGLMYDLGRGILQDNVHAYAWFNLAAAQGYDRAIEYRDNLKKQMTPDQIAEAQKFTYALGNWIAKGSDGQPPTRVSNVKQEPTERIYGSGFLVGRDGWIVTNHHVVDGCDSDSVTVNRPGTSHDAKVKAEVKAVDSNDDLALLKAKSEVDETATFSESQSASHYEEVTVAGYPLPGLLSSGLKLTHGYVNSLYGPEDDLKLLQISAPVQKGNSGGPLLDGAGNVIGVVVSKLDALKVASLIGDIPQNVNFAIKGGTVRGFLDNSIFDVDYERRPSNKKLEKEQIAERARTFTVAIHCWKKAL